MKNQKITKMPYQKQFDAMCARLSKTEFDDIVDEINRLVDDSGGEIATAGWLPGNDWRGTPFQAIYVKAAQKNYGTGRKKYNNKGHY